MSDLRCPNCGSDFISARFYWIPNKYMKDATIDVYICGDCNNKIDPITKSILPSDWMPELLITKSNKQVSFFSQKVNDKDFVYEKWRPYVTRAFDGTWFNGTFKMDKEEYKLYYPTLHQMLSELMHYTKTAKVPDWHKYKQPKYRQNELETLELVAGQIGNNEEQQWEYLEENFSYKEGIKVKKAGYFYVLTWKKEKRDLNGIQKSRSRTRRRKNS